MTPASDQPVIVDDAQKQHLEQISGHVSMATDKKTSLSDIQPAIEQEPLDQKTKQEAEDYTEEKPEQDSKLGFLFPSLRKSTRTTKALNFLGKKMEWLKKRSGGDVNLK